MAYIGIKPSDVAGAGQANITGSLTAGSATVTDDLIVDTNTLYVDSANNRVGIGNAAPTTALDVTGDITLSGGVYLGGTGSANQLSDYEIGTWTPYLEAAPTNPSVTYEYQKGFYTKIGDTVHVGIAIRSTAFSGGSGILRVTLPFAVTGSAFYRTSGYFAYQTMITNPSSGGTPMVFIASGDSFLYFYNATTAGKSSSAISTTNTASGYLQMFATYKTDA